MPAASAAVRITSRPACVNSLRRFMVMGLGGAVRWLTLPDLLCCEAAWLALVVCVGA